MDSKFVRMEELWIEDIVERIQAPPIFLSILKKFNSHKVVAKRVHF